MGFWDTILEIVRIKPPEVKAANVATAGPPPDEHPTVPISTFVAAGDAGFMNGDWEPARLIPAHPGRVGGLITPQTLIVHTTDTYPGGFNAIVKSWTTTPGAGNGAHFLIGRGPGDGVVQFVSILRNANHAGGKDCGGFLLPSGAVVHPNTCSVGVELDNAGRLVNVGGKWKHPDTQKEIPAADVFVDSRGHGWHAVTQYQIDTLFKLWTDLKPVLLQKPWPAGTRPTYKGTYAANGVPWAEVTNPILTGHATTNPIQKTDPGPQVMALARSWAAG